MAGSWVYLSRQGLGLAHAAQVIAGCVNQAIEGQMQEVGVLLQCHCMQGRNTPGAKHSQQHIGWTHVTVTAQPRQGDPVRAALHSLRWFAA